MSLVNSALDFSNNLERPKSANLTSICRVKRMFSGLMSLWITHYECKYESPSKHYLKTVRREFLSKKCFLKSANTLRS